MATILNSAPVRSYLAEQGIIIPQTTLFLGAEHNTTNDTITLYHSDQDCQGKKDNSRAQIHGLKRALDQAGAMNRSKRSKTLGNQDPLVRALDWAQIRPEWGAANHASLIIAPRSMTATLDLEGRAFMHSYDWDQDPDGVFLRALLNAPLRVVQWINGQYLFSSLDYATYGAGSKTTTNITGKIGVIQGNASDLMTGLPLQALYTSHGQAYHTPMRLMVIVRASCSMITTILGENTVLNDLVRHGWIVLSAIDPQTHQATCLQRNLTWVPA
jgi:hypothetical protein